MPLIPMDGEMMTNGAPLLPDPSPVSRYARSTLSLKGRGEASCSFNHRTPLLPLREKVPGGRMRGLFLQTKVVVS